MIRLVGTAQRIDPFASGVLTTSASTCPSRMALMVSSASRSRRRRSSTSGDARGVRRGLDVAPIVSSTYDLIFVPSAAKSVVGSSSKTRSSGLKFVAPCGPIFAASFTRLFGLSLVTWVKKYASG